MPNPSNKSPKGPNQKLSYEFSCNITKEEVVIQGITDLSSRTFTALCIVNCENETNWTALKFVPRNLQAFRSNNVLENIRDMKQNLFVCSYPSGYLKIRQEPTFAQRRRERRERCCEAKVSFHDLSGEIRTFLVLVLPFLLRKNLLRKAPTQLNKTLYIIHQELGFRTQQCCYISTSSMEKAFCSLSFQKDVQFSQDPECASWCWLSSFELQRQKGAIDESLSQDICFSLRKCSFFLFLHSQIERCVPNVTGTLFVWYRFCRSTVTKETAIIFMCQHKNTASLVSTGSADKKARKRSFNASVSEGARIIHLAAAYTRLNLVVALRQTRSKRIKSVE